MNTRIKILELKIQAQRLKISFETVIKQIYETELKSLVKEEIKNTIESTQTLITTPIERSIKTINPKDFEKPITTTSSPQKPQKGSSEMTVSEWNESFNKEPIANMYRDIAYARREKEDHNDSVSIKSGSVTNFPISKSKVFLKHPLSVINSDELNEVISM